MKKIPLTTTTLILAGLLCAIPGARADGFLERAQDHSRDHRHSRQYETGRHHETYAGRRDRESGTALDRTLRFAADQRSERSRSRFGDDRRDERKQRRSDRRDGVRRDGVRRDGVRRDGVRRDGVRRGDEVRREQRPRKQLPPSRIYRPVPQHQRIYRERERYMAPKGYVLDRRYRHDRYYPRRGHIVTRLPRDHRIVHYRGTSYYYWGGIWYRPSGVSFIVVSPPIGIVVPFLPFFYTTLWVQGIPYYYADGVYYTYSAADAGYVVVESPDTDTAGGPLPPQEELFIYPSQGQSAQQQANDRYECHRWAVGQTGFDPTQPPTGLSRVQFSDQRAEYLRAMRACLEGRGYSVR